MDTVALLALRRMRSQLAKEFRSRGRRVVAIDNGSGAEDIAGAYRSGVAIIRGDACLQPNDPRHGWN